MTFIPYAKQSILEEDIQSVSQALRQDCITRGSLVQQFEEAIAHYCEVPYVVAFNSGTAALMAAYFAANLTLADQVITTPNSFIATIGAPLQMGIRPVFIDIDRTTGALNMNLLDEYINFRSSRSRPFIVPVHFSGIALDMKTLEQKIRNPDAVIIEDGAHALGSRYPSGEKVGSCAYSQMTIFSFHPAKIITTGEGGAVTTCDPELYLRLKLFRDNGIERAFQEEKVNIDKQEYYPGYYQVRSITGNFNVTNFQAALGLSQLSRLDKIVERRRQHVQHYRKRLQHLPSITLFSDLQDSSSAFHLFVAQINFEANKTSKEKVMQSLQNKGVGTQVHYIPLYHHPVLRHRHLVHTRCEKMETYYKQTLSLPLYFDLQESQIDRICDILLELL